MRENEHRPILPGLVRVAEIHWFDANQILQIVFGAACALLTAGLIALACWREQSLGRLARGAGVFASLAAIFWFGNARMLIHGNELVHAYLVTASVALGAWAVWRARTGAAMRWMLVATLAGMVAAFSFGSGMALFPALTIAAFGLGLGWRAWSLPLLGCGIALGLYLGVLPGDATIRATLEFRPWDSALMACRWIASPWINAWLGFADPPYIPPHAGLLAQGHGRYLVESANWVQSATGLSWATSLATLIGASGFCLLGAWLLRLLSLRRIESRLELLAGVLMMFGAAAAVVVSVGRLGYLELHPEQVFADRYLVWPCLFWLGVFLMLIGWRGRLQSARQVSAVLVAVVASIALWPTHELGIGWTQTLQRGNEQMAAAARADVIDPDVFWRDDPSVLFDDKLRSLQLFRERRLVMFAMPGATAIGERWNGELDTRITTTLRMSDPEPVSDVRDGRHPAHFFAVVEQGLDAIDAETEILAVLDPTQRIVGYAQFAFSGEARPALQWWPHRKRGFDAFIRDYEPTARYRVVALDFNAGRGQVLGEIEPRSR